MPMEIMDLTPHQRISLKYNGGCDLKSFEHGPWHADVGLKLSIFGDIHAVVTKRLYDKKTDAFWITTQVPFEKVEDAMIEAAAHCYPEPPLVASA